MSSCCQPGRKQIDHTCNHIALDRTFQRRATSITPAFDSRFAGTKISISMIPSRGCVVHCSQLAHVCEDWSIGAETCHLTPPSLHHRDDDFERRMTIAEQQIGCIPSLLHDFALTLPLHWPDFLPIPRWRLKPAMKLAVALS